MTLVFSLSSPSPPSLYALERGKLTSSLSRIAQFGPLLMTQKKWHLDVQNTPCARDALMLGIAGGLGVGLLYFMKSSESSSLCPSLLPPPPL